ncbi:hypothetical protein [Pseudomonas sp. NPDC088444]|uniref:hypothetical protein n=1 Tax=Pseudomonas sp. NPDC088444 TaxID=3364456 RepID=UPI00384DC71F
MGTDFRYLDTNLQITQTAWDDLKSDKNTFAFHGVIAAAKDTISRGGAFIIYCESTSDIQRRYDRLSELEDEIG